MSRFRYALAPAFIAAGALAIVACDGLKSAFTAHVDVVARAEGQELSVTHFAELLGKSRVPLQKNIAENVAQLWVSYHLLGKAAANFDSLNDPKLIDKAMWAPMMQQRLSKFAQKLDSTMPAVDTVIRLATMCRPSGSFRMRIAFINSSKFRKGSPAPMPTRLVPRGVFTPAP